MTAGFWLALASVVVVAGVLGWLIWEAIRLAVSKVPITGLVRYDEAHISYRWIAVIYFVVGALVGWLLDHFAHF